MKRSFVFLIIFAFLLTISSALSAEEVSASSDSRESIPFKLNIYGTLAGEAILYSGGAELLFLNKSFGINGGYSYLKDDAPSSDAKVKLQFFPIFASYYFGKKHRLYFDGGATIVSIKWDKELVSNERMNLIGDMNISESQTMVVGVAGLGYNYTPDGAGFYFKTGPMLLWAKGETAGWFKIAMGLSF